MKCSFSEIKIDRNGLPSKSDTVSICGWDRPSAKLKKCNDRPYARKPICVRESPWILSNSSNNALQKTLRYPEWKYQIKYWWSQISRRTCRMLYTETHLWNGWMIYMLIFPFNIYDHNIKENSWSTIADTINVEPLYRILRCTIKLHLVIYWFTLALHVRQLFHEWYLWTRIGDNDS